MIKADKDGVFANMIALPSDITAGSYTLAAYTKWMRNFGNDGFFYRQLRIADGNSSEDIFSDSNKTEAISVALMPEGGHLIAGRQQRIAYKAIDNNGKGIDVEIQLVDEAGNVLQRTKSEHLGMGYLSLCAQEDEHLFIIGTAKGGIQCRVAVPKAQKTGVALSVEQRKGQLLIKPLFSEDMNITSFSLVLYGSGNLITIPLKGYVDNTTVIIPIDEIRVGIVNLALIDNNYNVWSERMVFIRNHGRF